MNINLNTLSNVISIPFKSKLLPLSDLQKKILMIVSIAFTCLAACHAVIHYSLKTGIGKKVSLFGMNVREGNFIIYKLNGRGKETSWLGSVKEGIFRNNTLLQGTITYRNGNVYEGRCEDGKPHGQGKLTASPNNLLAEVDNGSIYEGAFVNGKPNGQGRLIYSPQLIYQGEFRNGKPIHGKLTYPGHHPGLICEGAVTHGCIHGKGKRTEPDGTVYQGNFIGSIFTDGPGSITYPDGTVEEGDFKRDYAFENANGRPSQHAKLWGRGKKTWADGRVQEGQFDRGVFVEA